jgi:hypothetical protein
LILETPFQAQRPALSEEGLKPSSQEDLEMTKTLEDDSDSKYFRNRMTFDDEETNCPFIAEWQAQKSAKPTCNHLHEVGIQIGNAGLLHRLEHIASGGFKDVWRVFNEDGTPTDFVLKTTLYEREFRERDLNKHRRDALVMDEATSSSHVLNLYGYCAHSGLVEAAHGTLRNWLRDYRDKVTPVKMLQISGMIARGVADMHLYRNGMPTVAHADIKVAQFLMTSVGENPTFKINDFNRGRFLTSKNPPNICPFYMDNHHKSSTSRSPEEYTKKGAQTDKVDVFSMGSVFYYILTGHAPFEKLEWETAIQKIKSGVEPPLPRNIRNSTDPSIVAVVEAMRKCRQFSAQDRANSMQISTLLSDALEKIEGKNK